ncbi:MAG: hypothetical protein IT200_05665 [Thermoleophilia bacterium]|nr:hypothetical protein [Thermoleophilia bacterium]
MQTVMKIGADSVQYADRLSELFGTFGVDVNDDDALDPVGILPAFVLSGASISTEAHTHGDHMHVTSITVQVPDELEEAFYATLPQVLVAEDEDDEDDDEDDAG